MAGAQCIFSDMPRIAAICIKPSLRAPDTSDVIDHRNRALMTKDQSVPVASVIVEIGKLT